jgi:Cu+-exporting ATPase
VLASAVRPETARLAAGLNGGCEVALLSGDNEKERGRFAAMFGPAAQLNFNQSPLDKLAFIKQRQEAGKP